jgi:hypothetical protein
LYFNLLFDVSTNGGIRHWIKWVSRFNFFASTKPSFWVTFLVPTRNPLAAIACHPVRMCFEQTIVLSGDMELIANLPQRLNLLIETGCHWLATILLRGH